MKEKQSLKKFIINNIFKMEKGKKFNGGKILNFP